MLIVDKQGRIPIYEQLISEIERQILSGVLKSGDSIPSVRTVSSELSVNPNTIQKAYTDLETRGITYSVPGVGRFVAQEAAELLSSRPGRDMQKLHDAIDGLRASGLTPAQIIQKANDYLGGRTSD